MSRTVVPILLLAFVLGACAGPAASPSLIRSSAPVSLAGTAWTAVLIGGQPVFVAAPPTAAFTADDIQGSTGCNHYGGSYR